MIDKFIKIQAKVLSLIAWSNGKFDSKEQEFYMSFLNSMETNVQILDEIKDYIAKSPDKADVLNTLKAIPIELALATVKNAYVMAKIDNDISKDEKNILIEIGRTLNLSGENVDKYFTMLEKYYQSFQIEKEIF